MAKRKKSENMVQFSVSGGTVNLTLRLSARTALLLLTFLGGSPTVLAVVRQLLN